MIDSEPYEVTYQLCVKSIKLFNENNLDELIYRKLKDFYSLRSKVVHGTEKGKKIDKNHIEELIDYAENIIHQMILKMIELNKDYTYKQINGAISKSIYISKTLDELLKQAS